MKKALVVISALMLMAFSASAATVPCAGPQDVLTFTFGCEIGGLTFSDFSLVNAGGSPLATMVLVNSNLVGSEVILNFNPSLAVMAGGHADEWFYFTVTGGVGGIDLGVGGTAASVTERACLTPIDVNNGNICTGGTTNQLGALTVTSGTSAAVNWATTAGYRSPVYIFKDILLQGPTSGPAELSSMSQSFAVPEPMTMVLFGSGLLGLGLVRRFRR